MTIVRHLLLQLVTSARLIKDLMQISGTLRIGNLILTGYVHSHASCCALFYSVHSWQCSAMCDQIASSCSNGMLLQLTTGLHLPLLPGRYHCEHNSICFNAPARIAASISWSTRGSGPIHVSCISGCLTQLVIASILSDPCAVLKHQQCKAAMSAASSCVA